jgi:hypothetical protein
MEDATVVRRRQTRAERPVPGGVTTAVGACETGLSNAPQEGQNRADSGTSAAQRGQRIIGRGF